MACKGCGTSRAVEHCKYPSNPAVNELYPVKQDAKSSLPVIVERRERAQAIRKANAERTR